jgi:hypothetical protein
MYLKNQDNFSVWSKTDPKHEENFTGVDGTIGAICRMESDNEEVGKNKR